jgi:hypothetical protein
MKASAVLEHVCSVKQTLNHGANWAIRIQWNQRIKMNPFHETVNMCNQCHVLDEHVHAIT